MINKHKQKKKKSFKTYEKSNKELNALILKNSNVCKKQEKEENRVGSSVLSRNVYFR